MRVFLFTLWFLSCRMETLAFPTGSLNEISINSHLERLALQVAERYFLSHKCVVVMGEVGLLRNFKLANVSLVHIEMNSTDLNCTQNVANILRTTFKDNCNGYIIQLINPMCAFDGWLEIYRHKSIARHNPKYFFLPVHPECLVFGDELFSRRESDITAFFLVSEIYKNTSDWSVILSTNNFYEHPTVPGRIHKIYMDEWHYQSGFKENIDLYPDKILDLRGKTFRVATDKYLPYASSEPFDGSEIRIAFSFCEKFNCTAVPVTDVVLWGTIYENLTANGVMGNVYNDRADVGILAVYLWLEEWYYIDYSHSYLFGEVTVMVPKPEKLSAWILPFLPFKYDMWIAFLMSLVLSASSLYFITRTSMTFSRFGEKQVKRVQFTTIEDSCLRAIGLAVLQQPSFQLIGNSPKRYLFTSYEFLYLILSAMYSSVLSSFLTVPLYHSPIDTFHDFAQSGIQWYAAEVDWVTALRGSDEEDARLIADHFEVVSKDQLTEKIKEGKYGFTIDKLPGGLIGEQDHETIDVIPMYHIMKEKLFGSPLVNTMKKGSPYYKHYNKIILDAVEYGHFLYWESDVVRKYLNSRTQAALNEARSVHVNRTPAVIKVSNILGVILIYSVGIIASLIAFLIEILKLGCVTKS